MSAACAKIGLLVLIGVGLAWSPLAAQSEASKDVTPDAIAKGDKIYHGAGLCYACHGPDAKGTIGPNLVDDVWLHSKGSYEEILAQILKGIPKELSKSGVPMPPKGGSSISESDAQAVAAYVWSLSHKGGS